MKIYSELSKYFEDYVSTMINAKSTDTKEIKTQAYEPV